jgi:transposase
MIDEYRRGWALRYLREAKAELEAARKMPYIAPSLVLEAVRKARNAIHYSLGEPAFIENVIKETSEKTQAIGDPVLRCLVGIEEAVKQLLQLQETNGEIAMKQADNIIQLASDIVETLTGEKAKD